MFFAFYAHLYNIMLKITTSLRNTETSQRFTKNSMHWFYLIKVFNYSQSIFKYIANSRIEKLVLEHSTSLINNI